MNKINGPKIDDISISISTSTSNCETQLRTQKNNKNEVRREGDYKMSKNFNISNYNLDLIKCLQNDSGIYFILDPSKAINDKKSSDVYDIFIPENSDGVTLHVQKVNEEYKCIGVSITKKGIDINTGTRIFNTKIADWLEQLFHFNKTLSGGNQPSGNHPNSNGGASANAGNLSSGNISGHSGHSVHSGINTDSLSNRLKRVSSNNSATAESNSVNTSPSTVINNCSKGANAAISGLSGSVNGSSVSGGNKHGTGGYNSVRHMSPPGMQQGPITNLVKNPKSNFDHFENNDNYNPTICNKKSNKMINQSSCNLNQSNGTNNVVTHIVPSTNLSSSTQSKDNNSNSNNNAPSTHPHMQQVQHAKQIRLNQMNATHAHKSHLLPYHGANYEDKNSKLYNSGGANVSGTNVSSANANTVNSKNVLNGTSANVQGSSNPNSELMKNNKLGCTNRQKSANHHVHTNHQHGGGDSLYNAQNTQNAQNAQNTQNAQNAHPNSNHTYSNHKSQQQSYNENFGYRPTLFNLLEVLANHNITTPDQRVCIRGIVTDFLNNELPHGKIYAYIGAVVGHDILHDIIRKLEKDPNRNVVPDASGLARIEAAFGLSKSSYDFMNHTSNSTSVNNIPNVLFNHRNLNSALLNNHIYSNILSNVAGNNLANNNANNNSSNSGNNNNGGSSGGGAVSANPRMADRVSMDSEKLLSNVKTQADLNNLLKYAKGGDKYALSCNNLISMGKKKGGGGHPAMSNMLNMRSDGVFNNGMATVAGMSQKGGGLTAQDYLCMSRNLNMQCNPLNNRGSGSDDEEELMKVIKKNIETYKMNNIKNMLISSVFGRIKWLKIMNESPHSYLYGHSIVKFGNKLYMFGGTNSKHKKVPFNHTLTFSLIYYNYKLLPLGGNYPEERDGHTTHLISLKTGLAVFLFGGSNENTYFNDIYTLDMETRKWSQRITKGKIPLPRDQHCSLVYPAKSEHVRGEKTNLTEGVIIFGGKCLYNNNIVNLNDMWMFLFQINMWVRINYSSQESPIGRYGMNFVWSDTNTLCLFGGEYFDSNKNCRERKLLDDMWTFRLNSATASNEVSTGGGVTSTTPPTHVGTGGVGSLSSLGNVGNIGGAGGVPTSGGACRNFIYNTSSSIEGAFYNNVDIMHADSFNNGGGNNGIGVTNDGSNKQFCQNNLATSQSIDKSSTCENLNNLTNNALAENAVPNASVNLSEEKNSSDNENDQLNNLLKRIKISGEWKREIYDGNIGCRSNYSSIFITQRHQDFKSAEPKTVEKLMLLCSGITYMDKDDKLKIVSSDEIYVYFFSQKRWYLLKGKLYNEEFIYNARQRHVGCFFESKNVLGRANKNPVPCIFIQGGFKKNSIFGDAWLLSLTGDNPLRIHEYDTSREKISTTQMPLYYFRDTHSISLLYSFCTLQKWLFGAFANLVDNCVHALNPAENVFIKYELTPEHDGMLSIQDDGEGLDFNAMNRILRLYGNYRNYDSNSLYNETDMGASVKKHNFPNTHFVTNSRNDSSDEDTSPDVTTRHNNNGEATSKGNGQTDDKSATPDNATGEGTQQEGTAADNNSSNPTVEGAQAVTKNTNDVSPEGATQKRKKKCSFNDQYYHKNYDQEYFYNENANSIFDIKYGVGFKMSFARISSSCAIMSRTINTIGIGLLSLELMNHCDAKELATPLCMWKLPNKELINRNIANKSEHRHHQKLLMSYTPFNSPSLLAEQINILGTYSGTRLLYWDFRDDMDFIVFSPANNNIYLSSSPLSIDEIKCSKKKRGATNGTANGGDNSSKQPCIEDIKLTNREVKRKAYSDQQDEEMEKHKRSKVDHDADRLHAYNNGATTDGEKDEQVDQVGEKNSTPLVKDEQPGSANDNLNEDNDRNKRLDTENNDGAVAPCADTGEGTPKDGSENDEVSEKCPNVGTSNDADANAAANQKEEPKEGEEKTSTTAKSSKSRYYESEEFQHSNDVLKKMNLFEYNSHLNPSISKEKYNVSPIFPLWDHPKDSIDYCLSTYLYWLYLRRSTNIFLQNTLLIPTCMRKDEHSVNGGEADATGTQKGKKPKKGKKLKKGATKNGKSGAEVEKKEKAENANEVNSAVAVKEEGGDDLPGNDLTTDKNGDENTNQGNNNDMNDGMSSEKVHVKSELQGEVPGSSNSSINKVSVDNLEVPGATEASSNGDINGCKGNTGKGSNEGDGSGGVEGNVEVSAKGDHNEEEDDSEVDENGFTKLQKKKLEEALEYGISQEVKKRKYVHRNETDDSAQEDDNDEEEEEDDEDDEEEEEEGEADNAEGKKDANGTENPNPVENAKQGEETNIANGENNAEANVGEATPNGEHAGDAENPNKQPETNDAQVNDATHGEKADGAENQEQQQPSPKPTFPKEGGKRMKKTKNKREKNENVVGRRRGNIHFMSNNNDSKNEESEKAKKENYVNVYMETLKIKDEYYISNTHKYTLYNFLRRKLYRMVEFHYLFTPSDYEYGSFIMMGFLNDNTSSSIEVNRICEAGILLYYKNRLIKRLDAPFIDTAYNLSLSKYPPNPSLYEGNLYKYALTVIVNVPNWLKPSISKQEFVHENNYAFLLFKKKLVSLIKYYLCICEDTAKLTKWRESRDLKLKRYLENMQYSNRPAKNDSDNEYEKAYKIVYTDKGKNRNDQEEEGVPHKEEEPQRRERATAHLAKCGEGRTHEGKRRRELANAMEVVDAASAGNAADASTGDKLHDGCDNLKEEEEEEEEEEPAENDNPAEEDEEAAENDMPAEEEEGSDGHYAHKHKKQNEEEEVEEGDDDEEYVPEEEEEEQRDADAEEEEEQNDEEDQMDNEAEDDADDADDAEYDEEDEMKARKKQKVSHAEMDDEEEEDDNGEEDDEGDDEADEEVDEEEEGDKDGEVDEEEEEQEEEEEKEEDEEEYDPEEDDEEHNEMVKVVEDEDEEKENLINCHEDGNEMEEENYEDEWSS
ncbi:Uncharacterized protein PCOAH_00044270 [Plasmodium coatneyi]|uniref:Kelch domain-containing protein n=1 Tax=Plasmodium coatneyi TaxID=208452 RepID=A0A1B1E5F2_9APIC|nr:Uncharacterized protein PCOAH_00044270 [Plasmodium coatneyi]ANQ10262.1 Uncharacterized protein PCOAH_00044270 [Plasmodium coatneyi]